MKRILSIPAVLWAFTLFADTAEADHYGGYSSGGFDTFFYGGR